MKIRRFFSVLIVFVSCITFFVVPASAETVTGFYSKDMTVTATGHNTDGVNDVSSSVSVSTGSYLNRACTLFSLPLNTNYVYRICTAYYIDELNSNHEYNIKFSWNSGIPSETTFHLRLVYLDSSGNELKVQDIYTSYASSSNTGWQDVDVNFTPDSSGLSGYKCRLEFSYFFTSSSLVNFRISELIELTDRDDYSDVLEGILAAILKLDSDIDTYISDLESSLISQLVTLDNNIDSYLDELGGELVSAITTLDSNIDGYFELLKNGIIENDNALSDKLHEYLDKYKPRFYESLNWVHGRLLSLGGSFYDSPDSIVKKRGVSSDLFYIPSGLNYKCFIDFDSSMISDFQIFKYSLNGEFIEYLGKDDIPLSTEFTLESGFAYRFQMIFTFTVSDMADLSDLCNSFVRIYSDEGWLTSFRNSIVSGFNSSLNPGIYEDPGSDEYQNIKDDFDEIEGELPTFDSSDMHEVDISDYTGGFGAVRYLFERFVAVSGLETLIAFSLMFGLGVFLIGRKVGG